MAGGVFGGGGGGSIGTRESFSGGILMGGTEGMGGGGGVAATGCIVLPGGEPDGGLFATRLDLTYEFGGEAEVRGDHVLGDALDKFGEVGVEMMIAFFSGEGVDVEEALLGGGEGALDDEAEVVVELRE